MERFVVTHTKEGLWSVSQDGQALAIYRTEEEALSVTFALAAKRNRAGIKMVVVITREMQGEYLCKPTQSQD